MSRPLLKPGSKTGAGVSRSDSGFGGSSSESKEPGRISQTLADISYMDDAPQTPLTLVPGQHGVEIEGKADVFDPDPDPDHDPVEEEKLVAQKAFNEKSGVPNVEIDRGSASKKKQKVSPYEIRLVVVVAVLFLILITTIVTVYTIYEATGLHVTLGGGGGSVRIGLETRRLTLSNHKKQVVLTAFLGQNIPAFRLPLDCSKSGRSSSTSPLPSICLDWKEAATLNVTIVQQSPSVSCYLFAWQQRASDVMPLVDCFDMAPFHWYGMGFLKNQRWPLERMNISNQRLLLGSQYLDGDIGQLLAYYWITSSGAEISVHSALPMNITIGNSSSKDGLPQMCIGVNPRDYQSFLQVNMPPVQLAYNVCIADSIIEVDRDRATSLSFNLDQPLVLPSEQNFRAPIWSTGGKFGANVTQREILRYASDIVAHGYPHSLIVIDDGWEKEAGDLDFDRYRFPTPMNMTQTLIHMGFSLSLQVTPLISTMSESLHEAMTGLFLVRDASHIVPGLVKFPRSAGTIGAVVDVTHEDASLWFREKLQRLMNKYSLFSLRFVAGETIYLPLVSTFGGQVQDPNLYSTHYAKLASEVGPNNQICVGFESQFYGGIECLPELEGTWASLRSIVPSALTSSILGYPLFVSDPPGGSRSAGSKPELELYVRWMQLVAFFPVMHFSIPPHDYSKDVVAHSLHLMSLHETYVFPRVQAYLNTTAATRKDPFVQPLWWIVSGDEDAHQIDDEFVAGWDLLVAPVLDAGVRSRNVYIPEGRWSFLANETSVITGPKWAKYDVGLMDVLFFVKVSA